MTRTHDRGQGRGNLSRRKIVKATKYPTWSGMLDHLFMRLKVDS